ncbi:NADP-dependent oxidoreductase [Salinibacterium sp. UTAS2018]|uniref:NADP-dependent oxidoreductase n=1 Tax=Salinibacterium sp. UTAS2018 TaxID=2508880 RepID=UPI00100950AE|nr:NADP-dependent oxidoreductase [Salinibacterium sp. UTAS2018]QAV71052.1 NADP-dependent oxidoreductase [Salinibacterium sp. UTAS2018]
MTTSTSTQWQLASRPTGVPTTENVVKIQVDLPELADGDVRVRNTFLSVDPYMRGRMNEGRSYIAPFNLNETMVGAAVGEVIESKDASLPVGTLVQHQLGWRDIAQAPAGQFTALPDVPGISPSLFLSVLGITGITAWTGLTQIAHIKEGDTVFVSGAAGGVGTMVGQIARILGAARVVGSAGTDEKVALLTSKYGYDAAFNYKNGDIAGQLDAAAPDGIDVYFDNVGGEHLSAALGAFKDGGRVAVCGVMSLINGKDEGIKNSSNIVTRGLTIKGFTMGSYFHLAPEFGAAMQGWLGEGKIVFDETITDGIDNALDAFNGMMSGANIGKALVRI